MEERLTRNHITLAEIKKEYGIPTTTLKSRIGKFKSAIKKGKTWFIKQNEVEKYIITEYKARIK